MIAADPRKAIDRVTVLRSIVKSKPGQHVVQTARGARVVHDPLRFAALQMRHARAADHRLRDSGLKICLRHRTRDVHILNEIFGGTGGYNSYEPPPAIASRLAAERSPRILDLGANIGLFGAYVLSRWPAAEIHSFEPDPTNLHMLNRVIAANDFQGRWSVTPAAVANRAGEMTFNAGLFADSHLAASERQSGSAGEAAQQGGSGSAGGSGWAGGKRLSRGSGSAGGSGSGIGQGSTRDGGPTAAPESGRTITVRTADLFEQDHDVELMKMDIEGGEWPILTDPRLASLKADVLVLEWHALGCPEQDAHAACIRLLRAGGYTGLEEVERGEDNGLLWAWRETPPAASS